MNEYRPAKEPSAEDRAAHGGLSCWEFDTFIVDYLEDALSADARALFDAHLAMCPPCRAYLEDYVRAGRAARRAYHEEAAPAEAPAELIEAILKAMRL